ncbi:tetracycline resistance protein, class E-like isoform X2 [Thrips palmi]|uniref:Tetracycline resistance protein, class E-like isoform X2 n=1 Tax=Thrips palmi TaxID=161013 RepID=A0A6P8ZUH2_THRPL|nr:tetracycline resistance protein, class E-like isoform X2 [Thrips palmi]
MRTHSLGQFGFIRGASKFTMTHPTPPLRTETSTAPAEGAAKERSWLARANITVEPVMLAHMFAFMLTSVVGQSFLVQRACRVHLGLPESVCSSIQEPQFKEDAARVQIEVSNFHQYNGIVYNFVPVFLAPFLGAWSDRRGRKLPLLMGLGGNTLYFAMLALVASQDTWRLEMILVLVSLPAALTGSGLAVFSATHCYVADVTPTEDRTLRLAILDSCYLVAMPAGISLGAYLFGSVLDGSVTAMFAISTGFLAFCFVYSLLVLEWQTNDAQKSLKGVNICSDFFDKHHIVESIKTLCRPRSSHGRLYLFLILLSVGLYTFQRNEQQFTYLYTQMKFNWSVNEFSNYRTFQTIAYVFAMLLGVPLFTKHCGFSDSVIVLTASVAHAVAGVAFVAAEVPWVFYIGGAVSSLGPTGPPVLRSMASKLVSVDERGKIFAILCVAETAMPILASAVYSQVYNATLESYPPAIFWVTIASQATVFIFILCVYASMRRSPAPPCHAAERSPPES